MDEGYIFSRKEHVDALGGEFGAKTTYPVVRISSEVPDYLSLVVKNGFGLDFEATHDDNRSFDFF